MSWIGGPAAGLSDAPQDRVRKEGPAEPWFYSRRRTISLGGVI